MPWVLSAFIDKLECSWRCKDAEPPLTWLRFGAYWSPKGVGLNYRDLDCRLICNGYPSVRGVTPAAPGMFSLTFSEHTDSQLYWIYLEKAVIDTHCRTIHHPQFTRLFCSSFTHLSSRQLSLLNDGNVFRTEYEYYDHASDKWCLKWSRGRCVSNLIFRGPIRISASGAKGSAPLTPTWRQVSSADGRFFVPLSEVS